MMGVLYRFSRPKGLEISNQEMYGPEHRAARRYDRTVHGRPYEVSAILIIVLVIAP